MNFFKTLSFILFMILGTSYSSYGQNKFKIHSAYVSIIEPISTSDFYESELGLGLGVNFSFYENNRVDVLTGISVYKSAYKAESISTARFSGYGPVERDVYTFIIPLLGVFNFNKYLSFEGAMAFSYYGINTNSTRFFINPIPRLGPGSSENLSYYHSELDLVFFAGVNISSFLVDNLFFKVRFTQGISADMDDIRALDESNELKNKFWSFSIMYKLKR